ncbi:hypothetical protein ABPG74_017201 [Tetrahymena malaccensis]
MNDLTFKQKYLVKDDFYRYDKGPILFYCGNEGPIEMFYNNTGFQTHTLAKELNGLVVFMEHRYFGESWPFGNEEESLKKGNNKYLTSLQALNDYVVFLNWFKKSLGCGDDECPVIAIGGSYGGMLAAWIRMKFPNVVDASLAASAPIYQFLNREGLNQTLFYSIITRNYAQNGCSDKIHQAYQLLTNIIDSPASTKLFKDQFDPIFANITQAMNTCEPITNSTGLQQLRTYMDTAYSYMAMTNYPQASSFLRPMPAWPANASCIPMEAVNSNSTIFELFSAIKLSTDTFYNYDQSANCSDTTQGDDGASDNDMSGWNILACSDMVLPMASNGKSDMFYSQPWNFEQYKEWCNYTYGVTPNYDWALDFYGGRNDLEMQNFSNIFFSNGMLDPWSGGSPTEYLSEDLPVNYMYASAHHNDLRLPQEGDPESVVQGRELEIKYLKKWIQHKLPPNYFVKMSDY